MTKTSSAGSAAGAHGPIIGFLLIAAVADTALLLSAATEAMAPAVAIVAHAALAGAILLFSGNGLDRTIPAIAAVSMLALGPVGPAGTVALALYLRTARHSDESLRGWHRRLAEGPEETDLAGSVYATLVEKRAYSPETSQVRDFATVIGEGEVAHRQALLGVISQRFHSDHTPTLRTALTGRDPAVRVSAAAVFAKLRDGARRIAACGLNDAADPSDRSARANALAQAARSGLFGLDRSVQARAEAIRLLLIERSTATNPDGIEQLLCGLLLEAGRHREVAARLTTLPHALPPAFSNLLARALMRDGRHDEIPALLAADACDIAAPGTPEWAAASLARPAQPWTLR
jgi:hypothetical protein